MENEENKTLSEAEKTVETAAVTETTAVTESADAAGCKDKKNQCRSDARTFVIAFLTTLIMILAYHGLIMAFPCLKGKPECAAPGFVKCYTIRHFDGDCQNGKKPHFKGKHHHFEGKKKFNGKHRMRCQEDNCDNPRHRHARKMPQPAPAQKTAE